jgi:two-component system, LuxR family, response regulator FixJ
VTQSVLAIHPLRVAHHEPTWASEGGAQAWMPIHPSSLVLIAADDGAVRDALAFALRLEGFAVRTHPDEAELLGDSYLPGAACIILDDRRAYLDGFAAMARLRARDCGVRVILLTSHATAGLRSRAVSAGFRAVLEKPLLNNILVDTLRTVLGDEPG